MVNNGLMKKTLVLAAFVLFNFSCASNSPADATVNSKSENTAVKSDLKTQETPMKMENGKKTESDKEVKMSETEKTVVTKEMPQQMLDLMVNYGGTTKFSWTERFKPRRHGGNFNHANGRRYRRQKSFHSPGS